MRQRPASRPLLQPTLQTFLQTSFQTTRPMCSRHRSSGTASKRERGVPEQELRDIPVARDPWAILQQAPGVLADRVNVGDSESGHASMYVAPGSSTNASTVSRRRRRHHRLHEPGIVAGVLRLRVGRRGRCHDGRRRHVGRQRGSGAEHLDEARDQSNRRIGSVSIRPLSTIRREPRGWRLSARQPRHEAPRLQRDARRAAAQRQVVVLCRFQWTEGHVEFRRGRRALRLARLFHQQQR